MTLSVFICEDDSTQRDFIETVVMDYIVRKDHDVELALSTDSPNKLLEHLATHPKQGNIYLLDIHLNNDINGLILAKKIREQDVEGVIVFITSHLELSYLVFQYRIEALDYVIKGDNSEVSKKVCECIDLAYARLNSDSEEGEYFQVKSTLGLQKILVEDILFFESAPVPHKLILHTRNDRIEFRGRLKDIANSTPDFFRSHKAYVVNIKNVERVTRVSKSIAKAEMPNGSFAFVAETKIATLAKIVQRNRDQ